MLTQALDIPHLESLCFGRRDHVTRGCQLSIRKDVFVDECVASPDLPENALANRSRPAFAETDDSVVHEQAAGLESSIGRREVHGQVTEPDVLHHSYARDLVVVITSRKRTVVANRHSAAIAESGLLDSLAREHSLILAERDPRGIDSVMFRGVHDQGAPTTPDVEEALARLQAELPANQIELGLLRGLKRIIR